MRGLPPPLFCCLLFFLCGSGENCGICEGEIALGCCNGERGVDNEELPGEQGVELLGFDPDKGFGE